MLVQDRITTRARRLFLVFAAIFAIGAIGFSLPTIGSRLTFTLMPSGVAFALTYRLGRRVWPAVLLAGLALELWDGEPFWASLGVGIGLASGAWLSTWLSELLKFDSSFSRAKDVPLFILAWPWV
jgi:integral membrane sensor domain MASE1